jgi:DNA-directed RNA polymerase specialized sigma24 family protein
MRLPQDRGQARALLRRAVELGVRLIDTAEFYGPGTSERLIAEALHPYPEGLVIATKGLTHPPDRWGHAGVRSGKRARRRGSGRLAPGGDRSGGRVAGYRRAPQAPAPVGEAAPVVPAPAQEREPVFPVDRFVPPDDPEWPGHWANPPAAWDALGVAVNGAGALEQARQAIAQMPPALRQVIVLRDVEGATPNEVQRALDLRPDDELALLHQARGLVRARLERYLEGSGSNDER